MSCGVLLYPRFLGEDIASHLFEYFFDNMKWVADGNHLSAWFGDKSYSYGRTKHSENTIKDHVVLQLIELVKTVFAVKVNSALVNLYKTGQCTIGRHSDDEPELGIDPTIISLSLGEARTFVLWDKSSSKRINTILSSGSCMIMYGKTQSLWEHSLPMQKTPHPQINITFRCIQ